MFERKCVYLSAYRRCCSSSLFFRLKVNKVVVVNKMDEANLPLKVCMRVPWLPPVTASAHTSSIRSIISFMDNDHYSSNHMSLSITNNQSKCRSRIQPRTMESGKKPFCSHFHSVGKVPKRNFNLANFQFALSSVIHEFAVIVIL